MSGSSRMELTAEKAEQYGGDLSCELHPAECRGSALGSLPCTMMTHEGRETRTLPRASVPLSEQYS